MKKFWYPLLFILIAAFTYIGCSNPSQNTSAPPSNLDTYDEMIISKSRDFSIPHSLTEEEISAVMAAFTKAETETGWQDGVTDSAVSCWVQIDHSIFAYSADSGIFNDLDNVRFLRFNEADTSSINDIFSKYLTLFVYDEEILTERRR